MMNQPDRIEQVLAETPLPTVVEGPHRERLKAELLQAARNPIEKEKPMVTSNRTTWKRVSQIAAAMMVCLLLVAAGWAAEKVYKAIKNYRVFEDTYTIEGGPLSDPAIWGKVPKDGKGSETPANTGFVTTSCESTNFNSDNPDDAVKNASERRRQFDKLISEKKYRLVKTVKDSRGKVVDYVYSFPLPDGTESSQHFNLPLEGVSSWQDYVEKEKNHQIERQRLIAEAIKAGKFRLVNVDLILIHVCREVDSNEKVDVQRIPRPNGEILALIKPTTPTKDRIQAHPETSWKEHLRAVRDRKRELLDVRTVKSYSYEITLPDGSTTIFRYGGDGPLAEPKK